MLDASKAFDRVNYLKLFTMLIDKGLCMLLVRTLLFMYINQLVSIKWGNSGSSKFSVTNGVKQGGVLSPLLFTIYIDMLFSSCLSVASVVMWVQLLLEHLVMQMILFY